MLQQSESSGFSLRRNPRLSDMHGLETVYEEAEGPSLSFLKNLALQSTTQWFIACQGADVPVAAAWFSLAAQQAELIDIRVCPTFRGRGIGAFMLADSLRSLAAEQADRCFLEVRRSNSIARSLYAKQGFRQTGLRRDYYRSQEGPEDGILMTLELSRPER